MTEEQGLEGLRDYITEVPDDDDLDSFGVIVRTETPGGVVTLRSRRPRNILFNWKKLALAGAGVAGGVLGAVAGGPITGLVLIGLGLAALPQLFELPDIPLADLHSRIVEYLWSQQADAISCAQIHEAMSSVDKFAIERALQDLEKLRVIEIVQDVVQKREYIIGLG